MQHGIFVDHFSIEPGMLGQGSHEVSEVFIADVNHGCDREVLTLHFLINHEFTGISLRYSWSDCLFFLLLYHPRCEET